MMFEEITNLREVKSVDALVRDCVRHYENRVLLVSAENRSEKTFWQLDSEISKAAHVLRSLGIHQEDTVSLLLKNSPSFFAPWLGTIRLGGIANPINLGIRDNMERMIYILEEARAKIFITEKEYTESAKAIRKALPEIKIIVIDDPNVSDIDWQEATHKASDAFPEVKVKPGDPFQIIFTSGTTGLPKGVVQHHSMLIDSVAIAEHFKYQQGDVILCVLPLFHVNAQYTSFFPALFSGSKLVLFEKFSASRFFPTIRQWGVHHVSVVPSLLTRLLSHGLPKNKSDYQSLRFIICGAAPLSPDLQSRFMLESGIPVANGWGMTETGCWGCQSDPNSVIIGSMGKPLPINEMKIVNPETGREVRPGKTGHLLIKGPNIFREYFQNPKATAEAFRFGKEWFDTGDETFKDEHVSFYFVGRGSVDTGKVDGEFVNFLTLDQQLWKHPALREVCCVGLPDPIRGSVVTACVVLEEGKKATEDEIIRYCLQTLKFAPYEIPKYVLFVSEIPKGDTGKIQRRVMLEQACQILGISAEQKMAAS